MNWLEIILCAGAVAVVLSIIGIALLVRSINRTPT